MKKKLLIFVVIAVMLTSSVSYAKISDVPDSKPYAAAVNRLTVLGIMDAGINSLFNPDEIVTREQFAKIMVLASGLSDDAQSLRGYSGFPDVSSQSEMSGYINEALKKGYITGMTDGNFHPQEKITYSQACTAIVKALGYTNADLTGFWPDNYVNKASSLNLTVGITSGNNDGLPKWAVAMMVNNLLNTNMKKVNPSDPDKTFAEASSLYTICTVLGNSSISDSIMDGQILTDKGIFYVGDTSKSIDLGSKYEFNIKNNTILNIYNKIGSTSAITVESAVDTRIMYKDVYGLEKNMTLPSGAIYFYNGVKQTYDQLKSILQANTSIVYTTETNPANVVTAVIFDPVYSKPENGSKLDLSAKKIGSIQYEDNTPVIRDSEQSALSSIVDGDVVYKVSDIWGGNSFLLVLTSRIEGKFQGFLPNQASAKQVQIDDKTYDLSTDFDLSKIRSTSTNFAINDDVYALLGVDGKIVDVVYPQSDVTQYAMVLNYSTIVSNQTYSVKMLLSNNSIVSYTTTTNPGASKGRLVKYTMNDDGTINFTNINYYTTDEHTINKDNRMIDDKYASGDIHIFNLISNIDNQDAQASVLSWSDMPSGKLMSGEVAYIKQYGDFNDVNVMVTNDLLGQQYQLGVIKSILTIKNPITNMTTTTNTIVVNNKSYTYNNAITGASEGGFVQVSLAGSQIISVSTVSTYYFGTTNVQAVDSKRIKINNVIYRFSDDVQIYRRDGLGNIAQIGAGDIDKTVTYGGLAMYSDYNSNVKIICLTQY